jgi:Holliday junction resolvasome RuvABC endonuclease subunit
MKLLALDPSLTRCGYALIIAPPVQLSTIITGSFHSDDVAGYAHNLHTLIDDHQPDFITSEEASKIIRSYGKKQLQFAGPAMVTVNADQLKLSQIEGIARGMAEARDIPIVFVAPKSWRAAVLGKGAGDFTRPQAKAAARQHCQRLKVPAKNHDIAEAVCIGLWGATCQEFKWAAYQLEKRMAVQ